MPLLRMCRALFPRRRLLLTAIAPVGLFSGLAVLAKPVQTLGATKSQACPNDDSGLKVARRFLRNRIR